MKFSISVIIPVYNAAEFVENAVVSAHRLEAVEEIILIEDGSMDSSLEVCRTMESKYSKVKLFIQEANNGSAAARNVGLLNARCEYIAFLDADDEYLPSRFEQTRIVFDQFPQAFGVYEAIGVKYYSEEGKRIFKTIYESELTTVKRPIAPDRIFQALLTEKDFGWMHLDGFTQVNRKNDQKTFFDESLRQSQDIDYFYRLCLKEILVHGNLIQAVALRGIHDRNRILINMEEREKSKSMLIEKWYNNMYNSSFSRIINRKLIKDKISLNIDYSKNRVNVKVQIIFEFAKLSLSNPGIILKWFA